jgi:hypothetical protein
MKLFYTNRLLSVVLLLVIISAGVYSCARPRLFGARTDNPWSQSNSDVYYSGKVGIGTTTPQAQLSVGNTGTSTIDLGRFCFKAKDVANNNFYLFLTNKGTWATSSASCF